MKVTVYEDTQFAFEDMIRRMMRRNYPLLQSLRLEMEDVYQDLALTAIQASRAFDPTRSASLDFRPCMNSVEYDEERGFPLMAPEREPVPDLRLRQALSRLEPQERQVVILYLNGERPCRKQRDSFHSALEKLREFYLDQAVFCRGGAL